MVEASATKRSARRQRCGSIGSRTKGGSATSPIGTGSCGGAGFTHYETSRTHGHVAGSVACRFPAGNQYSLRFAAAGDELPQPFAMCRQAQPPVTRRASWR